MTQKHKNWIIVGTVLLSATLIFVGGVLVGEPARQARLLEAEEERQAAAEEIITYEMAEEVREVYVDDILLGTIARRYPHFTAKYKHERAADMNLSFTVEAVNKEYELQSAYESESSQLRNVWDRGLHLEIELDYPLIAEYKNIASFGFRRTETVVNVDGTPDGEPTVFFSHFFVRAYDLMAEESVDFDDVYASRALGIDGYLHEAYVQEYGGIPDGYNDSLFESRFAAMSFYFTEAGVHTCFIRVGDEESLREIVIPYDRTDLLTPEILERLAITQE